MKTFHLHLVSDSTGETVGSAARAALAQFRDAEEIEHNWTLVRTDAQMKRVINGIKENPGLVLFTVVDEALSNTLRLACKRLSVPCLGVIAPVVSLMSAYLGEEKLGTAGRQHELDDEYFERVEAVNYTLAHDDGQAHWELEEADIVLVGPSRTSKSPTCVYLAHKGYKAANVPYVPGCPLPDNLFELKHPLLIGLTIRPEHLLAIRQSRLNSLKQEEQTNYVDNELIEQEIEASRKLFRQHGWPVIDVSKKSVEETCATIVQYLDRFREKKT